MGPLHQLETQLDKSLGSGSSYRLSHETQKSIANAAWVGALIIGLVQLWAAWALWQLGHAASSVVNYINSLSIAYGHGSILNAAYYLAFAVVLVDGAILVLAVPGLKAMKKQGWNLLYYSLLLNVVYGLVRMFANVGGGFGEFLFQLLASAVVAYFLFQIRSLFLSHGDSSRKESATHSHSVPSRPKQ